MILEGLFGGILGGVLRITPEILNFFDKKNERKHELEMFTLQTELEKVKGEFKVEEKYVDFSTAELNALSAAYKEQESAVSKASTWVANLSASVRPGITYAVFSLYFAIKISLIISAIATGQAWVSLMGVWAVEDMAMLNMVISYWFVNRSIEKYRQ